MFARTSSAPVAPVSNTPARFEAVHLMLVRTPKLTPRGHRWLERAQSGGFDGLALQRLIRFEKLSLG